MSPVDVFETVVVGGTLLGALKLRYDDRAAVRKDKASEAAKIRAEAKAIRAAEAKAQNGGTP